MASEPDENSRGAGLLLRLSGVVLPAGVFFALFFGVELGILDTPGAGAPRALTAVFQAIAFLWSWPYHMHHDRPFSFGALAVIAVLVALLQVARRDRRGWIFTLLFSLVFGWLVATIVGQAQGY
jgi:hypothetical protein